MTTLRIAAAIIVAFSLTTAANARHLRHRVHEHAVQQPIGCIWNNEGHTVCAGAGDIAPNYRASRIASTYQGDSTTIIGGRPSGCPHAYCGCGLRKYLGLDDVRLNLASNWTRLFPHESSPRPGLAAVRPGHVMYIEAAAGNDGWLIRDYNSGGGLSRLHVRDVRGYVFVNPSYRTSRVDD